MQILILLYFYFGPKEDSFGPFAQFNKLLAKPKIYGAGAEPTSFNRSTTAVPPHHLIFDSAGTANFPFLRRRKEFPFLSTQAPMQRQMFLPLL